ncbi:MAG: Ig-like domain-containing protein [Eubacteriales bacterium]
MKKINILLTVFLLVMLMCLSLSAADLLSPAISVMQNETRLIKTCIGENAAHFTAYDFDSVLGMQAGSAVITELPSSEAGTLKLGEADVLPGQIITREEFEELVFVPSGGEEATFRFRLIESGYESSFECAVIPMEKLNFAPVARADELAAKENIAVFASLAASDPDEDEVTFHITKNARHGNVTLLDRSTGEIKYTPDENFRGKDKFTFVAVDKYGNESAPATVKIQVERNRLDIEYSDMQNDSAHMAAVILAENDILTGEKLGDMRTFFPEKEISRADFLIMAMRASDIDKGDASAVSFFTDDASFTGYQRRYIAKAQEMKLVYGFDTDDGAVFRPNESITLAHAATIVGRIAGIEKYSVDDAVCVFADEKTEITQEGIDVLASLGVFADTSAEKALSRAEAAKLLLYMLESR